MKIIAQKPTGFVPFSILIESVQEANYLSALIGATDGRVDDLFGLDSDKQFELYQELSKHTDSEEFKHHIDVSVR